MVSSRVKMDKVKLPSTVLPCGSCGQMPELTLEYNDDHYMLSCDGCYKKHKTEENAPWFGTFPWRDLNDAVAEWNEAVKTGHGVIKCPECLEVCAPEELVMFGGLCEKCFDFPHQA